MHRAGQDMSRASLSLTRGRGMMKWGRVGVNGTPIPVAQDTPRHVKSVLVVYAVDKVDHEKSNEFEKW